VTRALFPLFLLLALIAAASAWAAPAIYFDSAKPSWYDASLLPNQYKVVVAPEYGRVNFTFSQTNNNALTPTLTWWVATNYTVYGGKALVLDVTYSSAVQRVTLTLQPATGSTLYPIAVAVYIYTTAAATLSPSYDYMQLIYTDGTSQTIGFSGTTAANVWTRLTAYVNASKPVSQIVVSNSLSASYILRYRIYIEYSGLRALTYSLTDSAVTVSMPRLFNATLQYWVARFSKPVVAISPAVSLFLDEAHGTATGSYTAALASYSYVYTLAQSYVLALLDGSLNALASSTGSGKVTVASDVEVAYIKLNSTLLYGAALLNNTVLAPPQSGVSAVTFTVQDFGAGFQILQVSDLQGRIVGSGLIGSTGQVALNLTPYASYMITVCKPGLCKSVGLVTISSANIQLTVMPSIPAVSPPSWVSVAYDHSAKALRVNVSCASPPCTVSVFKSVVWYNSWQMRLPVSLKQGWNLVFLRKSSTVSASGLWAYVNASSWSEIRFGDESGLPEKFLPYSIIWSNSTHAQVLVYAPQAGTYYLYWQSQVQVPDASIPHPFVTRGSGWYALAFDGSSTFVRFTDNLINRLVYQGAFTLLLWMTPQSRSDMVVVSYAGGLPTATPTGYVPLIHTLSSGTLRVAMWNGAIRSVSTGYVEKPVALAYVLNYTRSTNTLNITLYVDGVKVGSSVSTGAPWNNIDYSAPSTIYNVIGTGYASTGWGFPGAGYYYYKGTISRVLLYSRPLSGSEILQIYNTPGTPPAGLILRYEGDPRYIYDLNWDGWVDWQDLSGNGNHATLYNFHARGSFVNAPQKQPSAMLVISDTCTQQLCSGTVYSEDPFFTVIVSDASGRQAQVSTGLSVPLWSSPLGTVVSTVGRALNLDAFGVNVNDLVIVLIGLAAIYLGFTFRNWELAVLAFGIWLTLGTLLLGGSGRLVLPGLSLALVGAALSYMLRREQQP